MAVPPPSKAALSLCFQEPGDTFSAGGLLSFWWEKQGVRVQSSYWKRPSCPPLWKPPEQIQFTHRVASGFRREGSALHFGPQHPGKHQPVLLCLRSQESRVQERQSYLFVAVATKTLRQAVWSPQCFFLTGSFWSLREWNLESWVGSVLWHNKENKEYVSNTCKTSPIWWKHREDNKEF